MATIECKCGAVRIDFPVDAELFRHECCCHDCISALWYGTQRGGPEYPHDHCADCCWLPNDFRIVRGEDQLGAFMNFRGADTTRFYCKSCWTLLFGDHPVYEQKIVVSQVAAYKEFEGLRDIERMAPQARHFVKDLSADQVAALPPWKGAPEHVYQGVAELLLESFPAMKAAGGTGAEMNAQLLVERVGGVLVPTDEERLSSGPPSFVQQQAMQADDAD
ncbi:MAG: hypothetical protein ACU85V_06735 [Gammaproteobacteria bacterium]